MRALRPTVVVALLLLAGPLAAEELHRVKFFGAGLWAEPIDDSRGVLAGQVGDVELVGAGGWELGVEWRVTPLVGLEASVARVSHGVDFAGAPLGDVDFEPIFVSVDFHLLGRGRWDWWVAPTLVLYQWRSSGLRRGVEIDEDRDETLGVTAGFDYAFDSTWALTAAVRYFDAQLRFGGGGEVAIDPLSLRIGVAARF